MSLAAANERLLARRSSPDASYSPMGMRPSLLYCGGPNHGTGRDVDAHGSMHHCWCCMVAEARYEWAMAVPDQIHVRVVPTERLKLDEDGYILDGEGPDAGAGPPFAPAFVSHASESGEIIVSKMGQYRRNICAAKHGEWADHRGQPLCWKLLWAVIANGVSIRFAADQYDVTPERAERHLKNALTQVWNWRSEAVNGWSGKRIKVA